MAKYNIYAGLGGGFGGANYHGTLECQHEGEALTLAYQLAVEEYESYEGMHGIMSWEDCHEEYLAEYEVEDMSEEEISAEVKERYEEEIEGWIEYRAVPFDADEDFVEEEYCEL